MLKFPIDDKSSYGSQYLLKQRIECPTVRWLTWVPPAFYGPGVSTPDTGRNFTYPGHQRRYGGTSVIGCGTSTQKCISSLPFKFPEKSRFSKSSPKQRIFGIVVDTVSISVFEKSAQIGAWPKYLKIRRAVNCCLYTRNLSSECPTVPDQ